MTVDWCWSRTTVVGRGTLYHGTGRPAWKKIKKNGLRPSRPRYYAVTFDRMDGTAEPDHGVYLTAHLGIARIHAGHHDEPRVLEVDVDGLKLLYMDWTGTYVSLDPIPARRITRA